MKFLGAVHYFACIHILIWKEKTFSGAQAVEFMDDKLSTIYVESFYLITTTITSVGYGDFKGYYDNDGAWAIEMVFLIFVIIFGIMLFSIVTKEIF